eukprot:877696-Amphidinium_carterae.1
MDLPPTDPPELQLAAFWSKNNIKLLHTGRLVENNELEKKPEFRQDHGKLNSWERYIVTRNQKWLGAIVLQMEIGLTQQPILTTIQPVGSSDLTTAI